MAKGGQPTTVSVYLSAGFLDNETGALSLSLVSLSALKRPNSRAETVDREWRKVREKTERVMAVSIQPKLEDREIKGSRVWKPCDIIPLSFLQPFSPPTIESRGPETLFPPFVSLEKFFLPKRSSSFLELTIFHGFESLLIRVLFFLKSIYIYIFKNWITFKLLLNLNNFDRFFSRNLCD